MTGRHIDDGAALALHEVRKRCTTQHERRKQIDVHDASQRVEINLTDGDRRTHAGAVHHAVDAAKISRDVIHDYALTVDLDAVAQIAVDQDYSALRFKRVG